MATHRMQTETEPKTKGATWRTWRRSVLSMVLGTALVYLLTARWPADDWADRVVQLLLVLAVFVALPFSLVLLWIKVWPTPWRYERGGGQVVRIRRSTGEREILTPEGWAPLGSSGAPDSGF